MDDVYNNIDDYNSKRKRKILIGFGDIIAGINTNKTSHSQETIFQMQKNKFISCI